MPVYPGALRLARPTILRKTVDHRGFRMCVKGGYLLFQFVRHPNIMLRRENALPSRAAIIHQQQFPIVICFGGHTLERFFNELLRIQENQYDRDKAWFAQLKLLYAESR